MTTRRTQERAWHRKFILERAVSEFAERGYEATTMDQIAEAAEVSKGTLYNYFASKEDLFRNLVEAQFDELFEQIDDVLEGEGTVPEKTRALVQHFLELHERGRHVHRLLITEGERIALALHEDTFPVMREKILEFARRVASLIESGQKQGLVRPGDPLRAAFVVLGIVGSEMKHAMFTGRHADVERVAQEMSVYILGALGVNGGLHGSPANGEVVT
jgi:AcrR family transcriptional regulator